MSSELDLKEILDFAIMMAKTVGPIIKDGYYRKKDISEKLGPADLVTKYDKEVEQKIVEMIKEKYPSHEIIGEESASENIVLSKRPTWVIDPIDGTTNFISQFPYCATLIGFMVDRVPVVGVAFNPILDELFAARKGNGATKNGEKITVNDTKEISKSLIITEFGSSRDDKILDIVLENMKSTILTPSRGIRALGACGPNVCCVASGQADLLYETGMHIWDICAVSIILEEAGGVVMNADGSMPLNYLNRKYIASCTPELAKEVASKLKPINVAADGVESQV